VTTWSLAQYTNWMIERPARGEAFAAWVPPEMVIPILYYKDAARAAVELAGAPADRIRTINYLVDGPPPSPSAGQIADAVRSRLPDAEISFEPQAGSAPPRSLLIDDRHARDEWGWSPQFDLDAMIDDMLAEVAAAT
jgi:nucleoside-diphosphate-sugar epimerase